MNIKLYIKCKKRNRVARKAYKGFCNKIYKRYKKDFIILEGYIDFSHELGSLLDQHIPQIEKPALQFTLLRIHEKAIKIFREAKILVENGSASGAIARWRTLYELSVVSMYLLKYPDLAIKYVEYSAVDNYKCAKKMVDYQERLRLTDFDLSAFPEIKTEYDEIRKNYGWDGKNPYEWAKNEDVKNPNLFSLAEAVKLEHLYAYVDEAHKYNHPSMHYLLNDRGAVAPDDSINKYLFTPFELELPIQLIAISLHQVNCAAIEGYCQLDSADIEKLQFYLQKSSEFAKTIIDLCS